MDVQRVSDELEITALLSRYARTSTPRTGRSVNSPRGV